MKLRLVTDSELTGIWIVWASRDVNDGVMGVYPGHQELEALRWINHNGYGYVEFVHYGPVPPLLPEEPQA